MYFRLSIEKNNFYLKEAWHKQLLLAYGMLHWAVNIVSYTRNAISNLFCSLIDQNIESDQWESVCYASSFAMLIYVHLRKNIPSKKMEIDCRKWT